MVNTVSTQSQVVKNSLLAAMLFFALTANATIWYVKPGGNNANAGDSWGTAFLTLQKALDVASTGDTIRIAGGTYYPEKDIGGTGLTDRDWTFLINHNLVIKGGYDPATGIQDFQNQHTVLSGDIDTNGDLSGNAYHVVVTMGLSLSAVLDGLHIEGGNADGAGSITYDGRTVVRNLGGGLYNAGENAGRRTSPTVTNCSFTNCSADQGAGMYAVRSDAKFYNCLIASNAATATGGGVQAALTQVIFTNCTFYNNSAGSSGGGLGIFFGNLQVYNSVFWANAAPVEPDVQAISVSSSFNAAQPDSHWNGTANFLSLSADPFKNSADPDGADDQFGTADDGLFPGFCSSLVAAGSNALNSETTDLTGSPRVQGITIDLGVYENVAPASTFYVNAAATPPGDGLTWATAFQNLQDAFCIADAGATINVAGGIYYPDRAPVDCIDCSTSRDYAFYVNKDLTILGGFDPATGMRDLGHQETILSGDIDQNNMLDNGNVHHVLITSRPITNAVLDGLTVTQGNANGSGAVIVNGLLIERIVGGGILNKVSSASFNQCKIFNNQAIYGGGCANVKGGVPVFRDCILTDNTAIAEGGGMYNYFTSPNLYDCVFSNNAAIDPSNTTTNNGGGMQNAESNPQLFNCVFDQNSSGDNGGAMGDSLAVDNPSRPWIVNCSFFGNTAAFGGALHVTAAQPRMFSSVFWNNTASSAGNDVYFAGGSYSLTDKNAGVNGGGVQGTGGFIAITTDPFRNSSDPDGPDNTWGTSDDGLYPLLPAIIDAGNNIRNTEPTDLAGNTRIQNSKIDIGAYESRVLDCGDFAGNVIYVNSAATGADDGSSWGSAFKYLQDALHFACTCPGIGQIWVAAGTYYPDEGAGQTNNNRQSTFELCNGVAIYGGFAGTETTLESRDWATNPTILSGDLLQDDAANFVYNGDNAYHVVRSSEAGSSARIDGFTISGGNANNDPSDTDGGGMLNEFAFPAVANCIFSENYALYNGGGMANASADPDVQNCAFRGNNALSGGGMSNVSAHPAITNCSFSGNNAEQGGGMINESSAVPVLFNCSFSGNQGYPIGGILNVNSASADLTNCILWGNGSSLGGPPFTVSNSIVEGGYTGAGNLDTDPLFVDQPDYNTAPTTAGDLHLQGCSPAIDAGTNTGAPADDLDGNLRPFNDGISDMGAYEFQELWPLPTAVCQDRIVQLDANGSASLDVNLLDNSSTGCVPLAFTVNAMSTLNFSCADIGAAAIYTLTVTDTYNGTATCTTTITVKDDLFPCIGGMIIWEQDGVSGVKDVQVTLNGGATGSVLTGLDGRYALSVTSGASFTITPTKNINKLNGLTAGDALAIQQHVTFINLITNPYKMIAADVNKSNSITTIDASIINQALLGNPAALAQFKSSWRFVPQDYALPTPPWGFPEQISLTNVTTSPGDQNFYGIKIGDVVVDYADPARLIAPEPFVWQIQDQDLYAGASLNVTFYAPNFKDLAALQFALQFDPAHLQLERAEPLSTLPLTGDNFGLPNVEKGEIRIVWSSILPQALSAGDPVICLHFKVLESGGRLSDYLSLGEDILPGAVYTSRLERSPVDLVYTTATGVADSGAAAFQLLQNRPNPFTNNTTIGFELPEGCAATFRVVDIMGLELLRIDKTWPAGYHEERLQLQGISGALNCELITPNGTLTRKMMAIGQ